MEVSSSKVKLSTHLINFPSPRWSPCAATSPTMNLMYGLALQPREHSTVLVLTTPDQSKP